MDSPDSVTGYRDHSHRRNKPELNINTSASVGNLRIRDRESYRERERGRDRDRDRDSMPQTPPDRVPPAPSKGKGTSTSASASGGRALRLPTNTTRDAADMESFLESLTPVDIPMPMPMLNSNSSSRDKVNDRPEPPRPNPRDSHDLSLSPRQVTRDSLVANMLLSLDQLSMGQINNSFGGGGGGGGSRTNNYDDDRGYSYANDDDRRAMTFSNFSSRTTRANTGVNGHGYSYSSDMEGPDDASRASSQPSRGRRSNSSSGFQSSLGRINSMREVSHQRSIPGTPRHLHTRGGKGSKSSSTNSIDGGYAQVISSQRWARGIGGRSSSFDYGETREPRSTTAPPTATMTSQSPWHIEFSKSFFDNNDEYDAAPTPTVPGGPRRLATVPSMPVMPPPEPKSPKLPPLERRRSTRSSKSATLGRKSDSKHREGRDAPPIPAFELDSAPAPLVGYEKSKEAVPSPATQPKEKQGFFRRMFGSSKPSFLGGSTPQPSPTSVETSVSRSGSQSKPPSRDSHQGTAHTLQKKTSSFFRRRKQSITDAEPPPIPTVPVIPPTTKLPIPKLDANSQKPEPSPITSLRKAMDPFLQVSPTTPTATNPGSHPLASYEAPPDSSPVGERRPSTPPIGRSDTERRRHTRGFSPDYEPDPKAVIRPVRSDSDDEAGHVGPPLINTPSRQPPEPPAQSPPRSFLQDNSDSEDSPKRLRKPQPTPNRSDGCLKPVLESDKRRRSPSPTVSKSKSSPNLGRSREELRASMRADSKLSPSSSRFDPRDSNNLGLPIEGADGSIHKNGSRLPSLKVVSAEPSPGPRTGDSLNHSGDSIDEPDFVVGDPTEDDRQKAQKIFDGDEEYISKERAAAWMGEEGTVRQRTLRAYMDLYDFENQTIVSSLRSLCQRLLLRAETQQVDRILVAFSKRWCDCNPNHGFKTSDIIHTICYSIILLNTDLHMADIEHKMTRSQFIKNTMTTIRQALEDSVPEAYDRPSILPGRGSILGEPDGRTSLEHDRHNSFRASFKPPPRPGSALGMFSDRQADPHEGSGPLVRAPFEGPIRGWESQVEIVLKDIYASIRDECLPLFGGVENSSHPNTNNLSVMGMLKRSPSVLSKAPSEGVASTRGRIPESVKANSSRWNSKSRSRPRGFGTGFSSSRTSFDDGTSVWSPTESSATWSKASLGRTHTSMSMDSFGSSHPRGDYQQSIGFANALSQAIIREDNALDTQAQEVKNEQLLEDDSLELAGPPWIKEGIVTHKHHLDGIDKRAKDRNWTEVFAVIQKGTLSLFSFSPNKSIRNKGRLRGQLGGGIGKGAVVGGGNWQENATNLGTFSLRQTLASALPPPGYSRSRPHVWALSLPTGAVHLFQVGTPEISKEFVGTANYWGARLSTHPLVGGVSNIEYGWSDAIINNALVNAINDSNSHLPARPGTSMSNHKGGHSRPGSGANATSAAAAVVASMGRSSMQSRSSVRSSSFDFALNRPGSGSSGVLGGIGAIGATTLPSRHGHGHKLPGDRIHIAEWTPPTQSMRPSHFSEKEQREALLNYVRTIEDELTAHNQLRSPMLLAFTPRSSNAVKAMANWERKSEYLLREIVKFRTYVDCLSAAAVRKSEIYAERETARRALRGEEIESGDEHHHSNEGEKKLEDEGEGEGDTTIVMGDDDVGEAKGKEVAVESRDEKTVVA